MTFSSPARDIFVTCRGVAAVAVERLRMRSRGLVEVRDADASVGSPLLSEPPQPYGHTSVAITGCDRAPLDGTLTDAASTGNGSMCASP